MTTERHTGEGVSRATRGDDRAQNGGGGRGLDPESTVVGRSRRFDDLDETADDRADRHPKAFVETLRFVYRHSTALVPASVLWLLCSLPVVTVGPASLGAYTVVCSLRETGQVDTDRVVGTVRRNLVPATLLGFLPVVFVGIAALYAVSGLSTGLVGGALTAVALYAGLYLGVLLVPTFVSIADGTEPKRAVRESYVWLASEPATGLRLLLVTGVIFLATLGLTVGVLLLFAGLAGAYHVEVVARAAEATDSPLGGVGQ